MILQKLNPIPYEMSLISIKSFYLYDNFLINLNSELYFLGQILYNKFILYLFITAVILLVTILGAVILINNPKEQIQMQHSIKQMTRNITIINVK